MHDIEPHYRWRDRYVASEDRRSPFYGRVYSEFTFTNKVYNYFIHPQWDEFGSSTLYTKILFADYEEGFAILEFIGEWNDCIHNDIMFLKREIIDHLANEGISKYIIIAENVLNFHGGDQDYYQEWYEDVMDENGWICFINLLDHVEREMNDTRLYNYLHFGDGFNDFNWRIHKPQIVFSLVQQVLDGEMRMLPA